MTIEILDPVATTDVAEYRAAEAGLADLRRRLGGATWYLTTVAGNKAARAARQEAIWAEQERAEAKRAAEERHATILREARIAAAENEAIDLVRELAALHPSDHERIFALHPEAVRIAANLSHESPAKASADGERESID